MRRSFVVPVISSAIGAILGFFIVLGIDNRGGHRTSNTTIQVNVLNGQKGLVFRVVNHWEIDEVLFYDEGWENPSLLDRVAYQDKDRQQHGFSFDSTSPEDWNKWQKRYWEIRDELAIRCSEQNEDTREHSNAWKSLSDFSLFDWGIVAVLALIGSLCRPSPVPTK